MEIAAGAASSLPWDLEGTPSRVFFIADNATHGLEVWTSDGSPGGTLMPKDVAAGDDDAVYGSTVDYAAIHQGTYYFRALDDNFATSSDVWRSDGTPLGTVKVREMDDFDASGFGDVVWVGSGGNFLWFGFLSGTTNDWEPFRTDGTSIGTLQVANLNPGASGSQPFGWFGFEGNAYFMATGPDGRRLWRGTGYPNETVALGPTGSAGVNPTLIPPYVPMVEAGGTLFFNGTTTADGNELFAYGLPISVTSFESADFSVWDAVVGAAP